MEFTIMDRLTKGKQYLYMLGWILVYLVVEMALTGALLSLAPADAIPTNDQALHELLRQSGPLQLLFSAGLIGPLEEEIIFRLGIYNGIRIVANRALQKFVSVTHADILGAWVGIIISSILFAAAHAEASLVLFMGHMVLGVAAAHIYRRTQTFAAPVILHAANNSIAIAFRMLA